MLKLRLEGHRRRHPRASDGNDDGFTLIELLVVLGILALLASFVAPQVLRYLGSARSETAKTQISALSSAVELYFLDVGTYPPKETGLKALIEAPPQAPGWKGPYLKRETALIDPWGKPYIYAMPAGKVEFGISTLGRDGQTGGQGEDKDIQSW